jgi:hypothetical protein
MTKMELLKRKSRRKVLIKELKCVNFLEEPFLIIEENDLFCKKVFSLLYTRTNKVRIQDGNHNGNIQKSIQLIKETIVNTNIISKEGRLLFFRENEIEAVLININDVFSNLDKILELTKFSIGWGDFILVAEDFSFGLCIERSEYFYECSIWGLSS